MRRFRLLLAALAGPLIWPLIWPLTWPLTWPWAACAEAPFAPLSDVPDYVAIFVVKPGFGSTRRDSRTVTHHGGWVRIDSVVDGQPRSPSYHGPGPLSFTTWDEPSGSDTTLSIMRGAEPHRSINWSADAVRTGDRATLLGESCEIWKIGRSSIRDDAIGPRPLLERPLEQRPLEQLSCIAPDGIELWNRLVGGRTEGPSYEATAIQREPVGVGEVRPPADRMALSWWLALSQDGAAGDTPGDVTVVMRSEQALPGGRQVETRTVRRHHPWTSEETLFGDGRRKLAFSHASAGVTVAFETDVAKEPTRLTMTRHVVRSADAVLKPVDLRRTETVAGEACTWFDMTPGMMDTSHTQCRSRDGVVLKDMITSRGGVMQSLDAVELSRAAVKPDDVVPQPAILAPATWGIPEFR